MIGGAFMTDDKLDRANKLKEEIEALEEFTDSLHIFRKLKIKRCFYKLVCRGYIVDEVVEIKNNELIEIINSTIKEYIEDKKKEFSNL